MSEISASVTGIVEEVTVHRGDTVKKGDVLLKLESEVQQAAVRLAKERAEAIAQLYSRKTRMEFTKRNKERSSKLYANSTLSLQAMDQAESDALIAKLLLDEAYENRRIAKLELEQTQKVLDLRTIRSPIDGIVTEVMVSVGELVDEDPVMKVAQIDPLNIEVVVLSSDIKTFHEGMRASVTLAPPVNGTYDADIEVVDKVIDAASGTFGILATVPNPEYKLPAGIQCTIEFSEGRKQ
jgi:RND family efflux transporter MFP subunit